jgi:hypothetical protein
MFLIACIALVIFMLILALPAKDWEIYLACFLLLADSFTSTFFPEGKLNKLSKIYSDSLVFGSAVHELVLQPESFFLVDTVDRPTAKVGFIADIVYRKDGHMPSDEAIIEAATEVDYYGGKLTENKMDKLKTSMINYLRNRALFEHKYDGDKTPIYLDVKSRDKLNSCLDALKNNSKIQELLHPTGILEDPISCNEKTILLDVEVKVDDNEPFILRLKSKLDNYTIDKENNVITVNDVKTTGKLVNEFDNAVLNFHYYRELGMYTYLLSLCAKKFYGMENPTIKGNFLVVSTIPNYYTKVVPITKKFLMKGFNEFSSLLKLVAKYKSEGYGE